MKRQDFYDSLTQAEPPPGLSPELSALWYARQNQWDRAHEIAQSIKQRTGSWIHAYLHRLEGDSENAAYWYARARRTLPAELSSEQEWEEIAQTLLR
jgi:hypothetical protein